MADARSVVRRFDKNEDDVLDFREFCNVMEALEERQKRNIEDQIQGYNGQAVIGALVMGFSVFGIYKNVEHHSEGSATQYTDYYLMTALTLRTISGCMCCYSLIVISYNQYLVKRLMGYNMLRNATRFLATSRAQRQFGVRFVPLGAAFFILALIVEVIGMFVDEGIGRSNYVIALAVILGTFTIAIFYSILSAWYTLGSTYNAEIGSMHTSGQESIQQNIVDMIPCFAPEHAEFYQESQQKRVDILQEMLKLNQLPSAVDNIGSPQAKLRKSLLHEENPEYEAVCINMTGVDIDIKSKDM